MSPMCLVISTIIIYILLVFIFILTQMKKKETGKCIRWISIIVGMISLCVSLISFLIYQDTRYLAVLFGLFFAYAFFINLFKQDNNYEEFGKTFFKHLFSIVIELIILFLLTTFFEKKISFLGNVVVEQLVFPITICIILYVWYLFVDLQKKYEPEFLKCKMITLLTFYINFIAIKLLAQIEIDNTNTVISSVLVVLSLLMNFIDKLEQFRYYFYTNSRV